MAPALTRGLGRVAYAGATADRPALTPAAAEASLADSLRRLRADHVAVLLLHEPAPEAITDELVAWLQAQRTAGRAREIGIGVDAPMREAVAAYRPWLGALDVIQAGWSLRGPTPQTPGPRRILHGVVARNLGAAAAETLVAAALEDMLGAEVIVASRSPRRLAAFAAVVGNDQSRAEARDLLTRQRSPLPPPVDADPLA
jgi:hypothetical protein